MLRDHGVTMFWFRLFGFLALVFSLNATAATATAPAGELSHPGPILTATVQRGEERLPIFLVDHLHKGDKLSVTTNKAEKGGGTWLLVLATVAPITNKVDAQSFDLAEHACAFLQCRAIGSPHLFPEPANHHDHERCENDDENRHSPATPAADR